MTENDWITATDPQEMLRFLQDSGKANERCLRLFAAACCRRIWSMIDRPFRTAVEVAERFADGTAGEEERRTAVAVIEEPTHRASDDAAYATLHPDASIAASQAALASGVAWRTIPTPLGAGRQNREAINESSWAWRSVVLRDVVAPFRPPDSIDPHVLAWDGGLVVNLARAVYEHRSLPSGHLEPDRLGVLADALEDAGCTDTWLLAHLRSEGPHVRGCHVLDLILGRGCVTVDRLPGKA